jgi:hypothetical protein
MGRRGGVLALSGGLATLMCVLVAQPAYASGSAYAGWDLNAGAGDVTVPVTGFPSATFTTDATSATTASGAGTYLAADTPFGQIFGSSRTKPYVVIRPAARNTPSTTTISFASPAPAGRWAFALGDIDADAVRLSATAANGTPVATTELGHQGTFNYCKGTPKPASCGTAPTDDLPTWNPTTATLRGNGPDTQGASGWFRPTVAISSLTLRMTVLTGKPVYQLWIAALTSSVSGALTGGCDDQPASGKVQLLTLDGTAVAETTADEDGTYTFASVVPNTYEVRVVPDPGLTTDGSDTAGADTTTTDATDIDFALTCRPETTTTTPPPSTTDEPTTTTTTTTTGAAQPRPGTAPAEPLATTGLSIAPWLTAGAVLAMTGAALLYLTARRRTS